MRRTPASSSTISTREVGRTSRSLPETTPATHLIPGGAWPAGAREPDRSGEDAGRVRRLRAPRSESAGGGLPAPGPPPGPPVCTSLTSSSRRAGRVARILSSWACVSLPAVTAASRSDLAAVVSAAFRPSTVLPLAVAMAASVLPASSCVRRSRGRDADVRRSGVERDRPAARARRGRGRGRRRPPGPPPSAKSGASALARRASIAVAWAFVSVPAVTCASIWSTIAFLIAAVSAGRAHAELAGGVRRNRLGLRRGSVAGLRCGNCSTAAAECRESRRRRSQRAVATCPAGVLMTFIVGVLSLSFDRCLHLTSGL